MELTLVYTIIGFGLAGYSVIANDSIQTLGTFIASKQKWFKWYTLASAASVVMIFAITWGWYSYDGDISYGRLTRIPYQEIQWYHAVAPGILLLLTRIGIPVSTTFLVLSAFATTIVLEKMLVKSIIGYGIAATVAYISWIVVSKFINEKLISLVIIKFFKPNNVTAPRTGIERRKDIFAESCLLNFKIPLAVIAIPDLLTPGTNDNV